MPLTRKFLSWNPFGPPNENAATPWSEKSSWTCPSNGAEIATDADGMLTSTVPSAAFVNVTLPWIVKIPPRSIVSPSVVGFPFWSTPTAKRSTNAGVEKTIGIDGDGPVSPGSVGNVRLRLTAWPRWLISTLSEPWTTRPGRPTIAAIP